MLLLTVTAAAAELRALDLHGTRHETDGPAPLLTAQSHAEHGGSSRTVLENYPLQAASRSVLLLLDIAYLTLIVPGRPKKTRDGVLFTSILPYLEVKGGNLSGVSHMSCC